ncbi:Leucine-rich repeat-containing protein 40 [Tolypocladium capitatum]|uniref:Leucine-rich repeat-containing protein 40 n=1 Tax=Tolypocladium capitatum TaxID=45235 RepID=A0A2K3QIA5_9HYPO|nr:Leucine-rich repeat-containing protein 40 [Tolypocladium capitatum]
MDGSQDRPSGIPRLSRLPLARPNSGIPRPALILPGPSSVRRAPSRESLGGSVAGGRELQPPKLRAATSRGQLRPGNSNANGRDGPLRPVSSRDQLRSSVGQSSPAIRPNAEPTVTKPKTPRLVSRPQRRISTTAQQTLPRHASPLVDTRPDTVDEDLREPGDNNAWESSPVESATLATPRATKSRPSLAERTMETLAQLPSSPAMTRRPSSFFDQGRPGSRAGSSNSRPGSSYTSDGSGRVPSRQGSRRGSSADHDEWTALSFRVPPSTSKASLSTVNGTPQKRSDVGAAKTPKPRATPAPGSIASSSKLPAASMLGLPDDRSPSPEKKPHGRAPPKTGAKTMAAKPLKPRASANGLFRKPSLPALGRSAGDLGTPGRASLQTKQAPTACWDGAVPPCSPSGAAEPTTPLSMRKSSAALRDQIAKAKAAKRAAVRQASASQQATPARTEMPIVPSDDGFDFGADYEDPFNLRRGENPGTRVLKQRVTAGRMSGRLNIAALGLKQMPDEVMKMYDLGSIGAQDGSWAESVDLTRLVAADNELETLDDAVFPDTDPDAFQDDEDSPGNIFGGLETLDLHGNLLIGVPLGFRRLTQLTSLNLSSNRLDNESLDIISQMTALRDLKLSKNCLSGPLNPALARLESLETLDLHGNSISALPDNVERMSRLRILNLSENKFESLPFDSLAKLPLTELVVRKNRLAGTLIQGPIESLPLLQTLDASSNALTHLVAPESGISLPVIHAVSLSMNRLQALPDMTTWANLLTLNVEENNISSIPDSFVALEKLRHADFGSNDIRVVPPEIARMGSLSMIRLTGNPLRDRKFASAPTDELKEMLASRLEPPPPYQEPGDVMGRFVDIDSKLKPASEPRRVVENPDGDSRSDVDDFATPPTSAPQSPARSRSQTVCSDQSHSQPPSNQTWPVKPGGLLDRSRTESSTLNPAMCAEIAAQNQVRQAQLHHNLFSSIPGSLSDFGATLSSLSLAYNQLAGARFMTEELELPVLREINLASNHMTSLAPLTKFLRAPALDKIDASLNRMTSLPGDLKQAFPRLTVLLASNNQLTDLEPESIRGLRIVDASNNDIAQLNPRLGLLGGQQGLQRLEVTGNRFKVPRWSILERGTDATLRWLRGRVPADEMAAWREENGDDGGDDVD